MVAGDDAERRQPLDRQVRGGADGGVGRRPGKLAAPAAKQAAE